MLSLVELQRAAPLLDARIAGHRVQAVVQLDDTSVVLTTYGPDPDAERGLRRHVLLSCRPESGRFGLVASAPKSGGPPPAFAQYLRAHLMGARVRGVRTRGGDRQVCLRFETPDADFELLLSLFGRRSNLYVIQDGNLVAALRTLRETRPELALGEPWEPPAARPPTAGEDRFASVPDAELFDALADHYDQREGADDVASLRRRVEQALRRERKRIERKLEKLEGELARSRDAVRLGREGELLKGALSDVKRGDASAVVRDFETGEELTIELDRAKSPSENLQHLFKRYQKSIRGLQKAGAQEGAVREAQTLHTALEQELAALDDGDAGALEAFAARAEIARLLGAAARKQPPPARRGRPGGERRIGKHLVPGRLAPRRYRTAGDLEIWVGRSDAGNDYLSTRLARGKDLFFHLDGAPGSHVILRTEGRADPPSEAILDACELAVHYSKAKNATRADVHVVPISNVKKPKGAKAGLVMVHGGKTVHLRRIPKRLERVLAALVEE